MHFTFVKLQTLVDFRASLWRAGFHKMALVVSISIFFVTIMLFVIMRCQFYFQVATQVAVLISKIARMELREWPELLPTLLKVCLYLYARRQSKPDTLHIVKAFTVLYFLI